MFNEPFVLQKKYNSDKVEYFSGVAKIYNNLTEINTKERQFFICPFSLAGKHKSFNVHSNNEKISSIIISNHRDMLLSEFTEIVSDMLTKADASFKTKQRFTTIDYFDRDDFLKIVDDIKKKEIGNGEGSNFVIAQKVSGTTKNFSITTALEMYDKLLKTEIGYYNLFMFFDGERVMLSSSPEINIAVSGNNIFKSPIAGTVAKNYGAPIKRRDLLAEVQNKGNIVNFLKDTKEQNELFMSIEEELKMMARICSCLPQIEGPFLKEMSQLFHTYYTISGTSNLPKLQILEKSMWAPSMTGSPLENAFRIIKKYEKYSRGYYSGALVYIDSERLDSTIIMRNISFSMEGGFEIFVGGKITKDSIAENEYEELMVKSKNMIDLLS